MSNKLGEFVHKNASNYAERRKFAYKRNTKKITLEMLKNEIQTATILGELSAAERILKAIVDNTDWERGIIEGELHIFIENLNNVVSEYLNSNTLVDLDDILKMYGYISYEHELDVKTAEKGLAYCNRCKGGEGDLPSDCPGRKLTEQEREDIYSGKLDYISGEWITKQEE